jgi:hypothetical protein
MPFWLVVLTDRTVVAVTSPPSARTAWVVAELVAAEPAGVSSDAALVSIPPVLSTGGRLTEAAVLVCLTPACDVQPSVDSAERPDVTVEATVTWVP